MDTKEIQLQQIICDTKYWQHNHTDVEKIRHITLHMGKLLGKLTTYCEQQEHNINFPQTQIKNEVIPDLLVYAAQLANLLNLDLSESYARRLKENAERFSQTYTQKQT